MNKPSIFQSMMPSLAMMLTMAVGSASILGVAVVAPDAAADVGLDPTSIGYFTGLVYFVGAFSGSISTIYIARFGSIRVLQATALFAISGLISFTFASPAFAFLCAVLLGLAYGPINPANASIMMAVTTDRNRSFLFSIKQSGVTVGGAFAATIVPPIVVAVNWRASVLALAMLAVVSLVILQSMHKKYDQNTTKPMSWSMISVIQPVLSVLKVPLFRGFSLVGFIYAGVQVCLGSFFVVYLVDAGFDLVSAGACFLFVNIGGIIGRLGWGFVADTWLTPKTTLLFIGLVTAMCILVMLSISTNWNIVALYLFSFVLGASSHSWNGIYLSEVASRSPHGKATEWTGGVQFIFYGGVGILPPLFAMMIWLTDSYIASFAAISVAVAFAALYLQGLYRRFAED